MSNHLIIKRGNLNKAAEGEPGEGPSFEQQFGILANAQITDKYPILSNYQIAVQMLDKSDDNSYAACVVVYKLGSHYVYVPAVFRKGKISTGEIMEVPGLQMFLPLSDAWLSWVKNKDDKGEAETIDPSQANKYGRPAGSARSREPIDPLLKNASFDVIPKSPSVLETSLLLGKKASDKMLDMLCNENYLNEAFKFYSPQEIQGFMKKASEKFPDEPELELISLFDKKAAELTEEQKSILYQDGYVFKKASKVDWGEAENDIKVVNHRDISHAFCAPQKSCKCSALLPDGSLKEVKVVFVKNAGPNMRFQCGPNKFYVSGQEYLADGDQSRAFIVSDKGFDEVSRIFTAVKNTVEDLDVSKIGKAFGEAPLSDLHGRVLFVCPNGQGFEAFGVESKDDKGYYSYSHTYKLSQDEDLKEPLIFGNVIEFPKGTRIVTGNSNENKELVPITDLGRAIEQFLLKNSTKVKMTSDGQEVSFSGPASKPSQHYLEKEAALHLVADYGISPKDAKAMLKLAGAATIQNPKTFTFQLYKEAAQDNFEDSPIWKPADISMSEHPENPPSITQEDLQNKAMQDEKQIQDISRAAESGVKEVFDTQTLKLLAQEADPNEAILEAIPQFMTTLDRLCQMLFLYRCHMQDMQERYGAVKMKALQKSLQNTIKDLSQLTIFVKLRGLNNGQAPDEGDLQTGTMLQ